MSFSCICAKFQLISWSLTIKLNWNAILVRRVDQYYNYTFTFSIRRNQPQNVLIYMIQIKYFTVIWNTICCTGYCCECLSWEIQPQNMVETYSYLVAPDTSNTRLHQLLSKHQLVYFGHPQLVYRYYNYFFQCLCKVHNSFDLHQIIRRLLSELLMFYDFSSL